MDGQLLHLLTMKNYLNFFIDKYQARQKARTHKLEFSKTR